MSRVSTVITCWIVIASAVAVAADERASHTKVLAEAETRLKSIYDQREFAPASFSGKWLRDSSGYLVFEKPKDRSEPELAQYDAASGKRSLLIGGDKLVVPGTSDRLVIQEFVQSPVASQFLLHARASTSGKTGYWLFDSKTGGLTAIAAEIPRLSWECTFSPNGDRLLFGRGPDLYVFDLASQRTTSLSQTDAQSVRENGGQSNWRPDQSLVQASWSPDGKQIAYLQSDSSKVRQRPVIHPNDPTYPEVSLQRFARVGTPIPTLRVGVVNADGGETRWLNLPANPGTFYISDISWAENSDELLIEMLSRSRDSRTFLLANTKTGTTTKAYEESDPAWVDASYSANAGLEWIQDGKAFVLLSERDGWRHAYLISRDGKTRTLLTKHASDIIARGPVDERNGWLYFHASPENATQRYLYGVRLDGKGDAERVTPADQSGTHRYDFSPDRKWAFHTRSTFDSPPVIDLVQLPDHRSVRVLEDNAECRRRVAPLITQPTEFLKLDIGGDVVMDAWMIKPRDFDPGKKYPVFIYVYGEPAGNDVVDNWGASRDHPSKPPDIRSPQSCDETSSDSGRQSNRRGPSGRVARHR